MDGCFGCKVLSVNPVGVYATRRPGAGRGDATRQKAWDRELTYYEDLRKQGVQPAGTTMQKCLDADKKSQERGEAFQADAPYSGSFGQKLKDKIANG